MTLKQLNNELTKDICKKIIENNDLTLTPEMCGVDSGFCKTKEILQNDFTEYNYELYAYVYIDEENTRDLFYTENGEVVDLDLEVQEYVYDLLKSKIEEKYS